eukprot:GHVN01054073.1.p1 GENE.GHVN01054073.1~~GHVN01054073.1.p1  ORF type:complete len:114 (+),score=6.30 GHVN01054073.1:550-891(+)
MNSQQNFFYGKNHEGVASLSTVRLTHWGSLSKRSWWSIKFHKFILHYGQVKLYATYNQTDLKQKAMAHYSRFSPFQFVAYWFELWQGYEEKRLNGTRNEPSKKRQKRVNVVHR